MSARPTGAAPFDAPGRLREGANAALVRTSYASATGRLRPRLAFEDESWRKSDALELFDGGNWPGCSRDPDSLEFIRETRSGEHRRAPRSRIRRAVA
jgi:hypothetical protein